MNSKTSFFGKKLISLVLICAVVSSITLAPRRAEAMIGATPVPYAVPITIAGAGLLATAVGISLYGCARGHDYNALACVFFLFLGAIPGILGLFLLDSHGSPSVEYRELSLQKAKIIGISPARQLAFNQERDEINAIHETIQADMQKRIAQGLDVSTRDVHEAWGQYKDALSPEAFSAVQQIGDYVFTTLSKAATAR